MHSQTLTLPAAGLLDLGEGLLIDFEGVRESWSKLPRWFQDRVRNRLQRLFPNEVFAGFTPDEGETLTGQVVWQRTHIDRAATIELGLFTNVTPGETITEATITEPSGTGYARITLTDASWSVVTGTASYAQQTFTGGAGGWTGSIQGYFLASVGTTQRLLAIEVDGNGPYTINENDTYKITPNITYS